VDTLVRWPDTLLTKSIDAVADGRGVVAHYSFGSQRGGMDQTDILNRYRSFARDHICTGPMLWTPEES
jgi:hypothetical protein